MLKPLKVLTPEDRLFFISDLHISHNRDFIYGPRGFRDVKEHDDTLVHRWNSVCDDGSVIFHLGDLIFKADEAAFWTLLRRLQFGHLFLLEGNHQSGSKQAYASTLKQQHPSLVDKDGIPTAYVYPLHTCVDGAPTRKVTFLSEYVEVMANKQHLVLCHYPLISHHGQGHNSVLCCGHSHNNCALTAKATGQGMRLDVGVESVSHPVTLREVNTILKGRSLDVRDHHGRNEAL